MNNNVSLRKIPLLELFLILEELLNKNVNFIDITGEHFETEEETQDTIVITVLPEYREEEEMEEGEEIKIKEMEEKKEQPLKTKFRIEDLNDLI